MGVTAIKIESPSGKLAGAYIEDGNTVLFRSDRGSRLLKDCADIGIKLDSDKIINIDSCPVPIIYVSDPSVCKTCKRCNSEDLKGVFKNSRYGQVRFCSICIDLQVLILDGIIKEYLGEAFKGNVDSLDTRAIMQYVTGAKSVKFRVKLKSGGAVYVDTIFRKVKDHSLVNETVCKGESRYIRIPHSKSVKDIQIEYGIDTLSALRTKSIEMVLMLRHELLKAGYKINTVDYLSLFDNFVYGEVFTWNTSLIQQLNGDKAEKVEGEVTRDTVIDINKNVGGSMDNKSRTTKEKDIETEKQQDDVTIVDTTQKVESNSETKPKAEKRAVAKKAATKTKKAVPKKNNVETEEINDVRYETSEDESVQEDLLKSPYDSSEDSAYMKIREMSLLNEALNEKIILLETENDSLRRDLDEVLPKLKQIDVAKDNLIEKYGKERVVPYKKYTYTEKDILKEVHIGKRVVKATSFKELFLKLLVETYNTDIVAFAKFIENYSLHVFSYGREYKRVSFREADLLKPSRISNYPFLVDLSGGEQKLLQCVRIVLASYEEKGSQIKFCYKSLIRRETCAEPEDSKGVKE